ncbi:MAG: nitrogenase cofactor biosynthesis protein NifB, partial [Bacteroidaceae bacterium]|nr:nitrogenase cofactor biosynthesis protein NifB [Bacteroidaceae bacterium]
MTKAIIDEQIAKHPCFDEEARHTHARVHLPVAPRCNIQCNYCNRKYDCVNESRPGVTSSVLEPFQAVRYLKELDKHIDRISVIGIAGPGDPFANPEEVLKTLRAVKEEFPNRIFCLSTNGLNLAPYIDEIATLNVTHVTLTINGVDPKITSQLYRWVRFDKKIYRGEEGARLLMERQLACIPLLKAKGIIVKINFIIVPGINDHHVEATAKVVKELGADLINCMPLIPTEGSLFEEKSKPDQKMIFRVRTQAKSHLPLMTHCARCRADAAGLLGQDLKEAYTILREISNTVEEDEKRPYVA